MIDLSPHLGLIKNEAIRAAKRYGGDPDDFMGWAYISMHHAATTHDPERGAFSTHAVCTMRHRFRDQYLRDLGYKLKGANNNGQCAVWARPGHEEHPSPSDRGITHHDSPLDKMIRDEECERLMARLDPSCVDVALATGHGLNQKQIGRAASLSRTWAWQHVDDMRKLFREEAA